MEIHYFNASNKCNKDSEPNVECPKGSLFSITGLCNSKDEWKQFIDNSVRKSMKKQDWEDMQTGFSNLIFEDESFAVT